MSKQITKTVYTFKELIDKFGKSHKATERARQWLREGATDYDWWDGVYDNWKEALGQIGFSGDGASFTADVDMGDLLRFMVLNTPPSKVIQPTERTGNTEDFWPWIVDKISGKPSLVQLDLCKAIYKDLQEEYEYQTADEQLIEDGEANEWYFDESGDREG